MRNLVLFSLLFFLAVGFVFSSGIVLAESGSGSDGDGGSGEGDSGSDSSSSGDSGGDSSDGDGGNSGSSDDSSDSEESDDSSESGGDSGGSDEDSDDEKDEEKFTIIDEEGREVQVEIKSEEKDGEIETKETRTYIDENGNEVKIVTKTEIKDGREETEVKRKITTPDGIEITFKTKTEIKDGREEIKHSIEVEGAEVTTKLSVRERFEDGETKLKVKLSTGAEQDIIILPDEAIQIAFDELQATGNFVFELNEIVDGDVRKVVFSAKAVRPGRFLGIFNTNVNLETLIDTETGEVIKTNRPWWAFLVSGADKANVCHVSEGDVNKRNTLDVAITAVKAHLGHGDSIGVCVATCGDGLVVKGVEACEVDDTQECSTVDGYAGTETCNLECTGFDACVATESCGDGIVNGLEACDDGNVIDGDGCDSLCQVEIVEEPPVNDTSAV